MRIQEVLARHGSSQDLKETLRELVERGGKLELDEAGLRALTDELGRLQEPSHDGSSQHVLERLELAELLLKATLEDADLRSEHKRVLLEPRFAAALAGLVQGAADALAGGRRPLSEAQAASLEALVFMIGDLVDWTGPVPEGGGKPQRGKDLHGRTAIPALLALLVAPQPSSGANLSALKRKTSGVLIDFLLSSRANCAVLAGLPDSAQPLFGDLLASCGDVILQIDLLEALYRCARAGALRPGHRAALKPDLLSAVEGVAARKTGKDLDLPAELRRLLVPYNRGLGPEATVFSAQARSVSINGIDGVAGSKWVDFGLQAFGLSVRSPEDEEDEAPEVVLFPYDDVTRVTTGPGATSGYLKVTVSMSGLPEELAKNTQEFQGKGTVVMQFSAGELGGLASHAPRVAAAMKQTGMRDLFGEASLSTGGINASQRGRKCSTGVTIYDTSAGRAAPGGSSGRAPLPLMRSGHKPAGSNQTGQTGRTAGHNSPAGSAGQQQPAGSNKRPLSMLRHGSSAAPLPLPRAEAQQAPPQQREQQEQQEQEEQQAEQEEQEPVGQLEPPAAAAPACTAAADEAGAAAEAVQPTAEGVNPTGEAVQPTASQEAGAQRNGRSQQQGCSQQQGRSQQQGHSQQQGRSQPAAAAPAPDPAAAPAASGGTHTTQTAAQAPRADGEVNSPAAAPQRLPAAPAAGAAAAGHRGGAGKGKAPAVAPSQFDEGVWSSDEEEKEKEEGEEQQQEEDHKKKDKGKSKSGAAASPDSPAAAAKLRAQQGRKQGQRPSTAKEGQKPAAGRKKAGLAAMKKGGKAAAAATKSAGRGRGGKGPSPDDPIENTGPSGKDALPNWMEEADKKAKEAGALAPQDEEDESDSESELRHDHASRQPLFRKEKQAQAAAAKEEAAGKDKAAAEHEKAAEKARDKGKAPAKAAAAVRQAAAAAADLGDKETEDSQGEQPLPQRPGQQAAGKKAALAAKAGAGAKGKPAAAAAGKKAAGAAGKGKAAGVPAAKRPRRAAAPAAAGKLAEEAAGSESEEMGGDEFDFAGERGAGGSRAHAKKKPAGGRARAAAAAPAGRNRQLRSPLAAMKAIGKKRGRESQLQEEEEQAAAEAAQLEAEEELPGYEPSPPPEGLEEPEGGVRVGESPLLRQESAPAEEEEEEEEEEGAGLYGSQEEADDEMEEEEEEGEEEGEEDGSLEEPPPGGYRSEGTRRPSGWTDFRPAEAEVPDMLVAEDELAGITKHFKFTAVKEPAAAAVAGTSAGRRSKAELKAAAAAGGTGIKRPAPGLLGLSGAKSRLTTTLSQEGLAAPTGAPPGGRGTTAKANGSKGKQPAAAAAGGGSGGAKAGGGAKRGLDALGQLSAGKQKRQRAGAGDAAAAAAAGGSKLTAGRPTRKASGAAAAAAAAASEPEASQPLSIHGLLQSVQRRRGAATPHKSDSEEEDNDLAAVQSFLVEMVRKKKAQTQKKQVEMVQALEREAGEALKAKEKELAAAQQKLAAHVNSKFAQLEKQLDAKMREIDSAALAFQQQLNTLWEEYRLLYDRVAASAAEAEEEAGKQRAAHARALEGVREGLAQRAAEVSARIERSSRKAGKMPELAQVLLPFLD
ncbi:hypothetical protein ABPG75_009739 [Micractinium tetrahymenae]